MKGFSQFFVFWFRKFNILVFYDFQLNLDGNDMIGEFIIQILISFDFIFFVLEDILFVGIIVKRLNFIVNIESVNVMFIVLVYIFINGGVIFIDGEKLIVIVGIIKFNIQIEGWQFCGNFGVICK